MPVIRNTTESPSVKAPEPNVLKLKPKSKFPAPPEARLLLPFEIVPLTVPVPRLVLTIFNEEALRLVARLKYQLLTYSPEDKLFAVRVIKTVLADASVMLAVSQGVEVPGDVPLYSVSKLKLSVAAVETSGDTKVVPAINIAASVVFKPVNG